MSKENTVRPVVNSYVRNRQEDALHEAWLALKELEQVELLLILLMI